MALLANVSAPNGLVPFAPGGGAAPPTFALRPAQITYNYNTQIFKGDPVKMSASGTIQQWTNGTNVAQLAGVFWGCEYLSTVRGYTVSQFWPASGDVLSTNIVRAYIYPCDLATPMWFLVQGDSTGFTQANVGNNCDVNLGTGSTFTGLSGAFINCGGSITTTNTFPFRIMRLYSEGTGSAFGIGGIDNGSTPGAFNKAYVAANITAQVGI